MATGLEGVATVLGIIGFSAQIFDGCVKGFNLLFSAQNLGRDADMFRCMLDWEQFRLEQWAERVDLSDPEKADPSLDWTLIERTLEQIRSLATNTELLKEKYKLALIDPPKYSSRPPTEVWEQPTSSTSSPFKKLFSQVDRSSSTAAAKVIQSRNNAMKKLWWASVDKKGLRQLIEDISHLTQRLYDVLNSATQDQMRESINSMINMATARSENVLELAIMRQLARLPDIIKSSARKPEEIEEDVEKQRKNVFFYAVRKGEIKEVESILDEGLDVESEDRIGWTAMIRAAEHGQQSIIQLLLQRGASVHHGTIGNRLPIHFASEYGHVNIVEVLLSQDKSQLNLRDHLGQTPLHKASRNGRKEVVKFLLSQNEIEADPEDNDGWRPLMHAITDEDGLMVEMILEYPEVDPNHRLKDHGQTPLWLAITTKDDDRILQLLLQRSDLELNRTARFGEACIFRASMWSMLTGLQTLLKKGADVNLPNEDGRTPLSIAASRGHKEVLEILLKHPNIDLNQADELNKTPLMYAAEEDQKECVKLLLSHKPSLEVRDKEGRTALSLAAIKGNKIPSKFLLKAGATVNTQDLKGNTPLALAAENNRDVVVRFLLENGADAELADEDEETPFDKARDRKLDDVVGAFKEVLKLS